MWCVAAIQAMKINAKINGVNHKLSAAPYEWMKQPYIVIGEQSPLPCTSEISMPEGVEMKCICSSPVICYAP